MILCSRSARKLAACSSGEQRAVLRKSCAVSGCRSREDGVVPHEPVFRPLDELANFGSLSGMLMVEGAALPTATGLGWSLKNDGRGRIYLSFFGPTATDALAECLKALTTMMHDDVQLIVDLRELDGHNVESRPLWRDWLTRHKAQLSNVVVVVKRAMVMYRMVTTAVGLAAGVRIHVVEHLP